MAKQDPVFEVLTRRSDGHETVHRFQAADAKNAKAAAIESGVPADQIVQASPELAPQGAQMGTLETHQEDQAGGKSLPPRARDAH